MCSASGRMEFSRQQMRLIRMQAGIRREQVALAIGRSYQNVAAYENGTVLPPLGVLCRIGEVLGVSPCAFLRPYMAERA